MEKSLSISSSLGGGKKGSIVQTQDTSQHIFSAYLCAHSSASTFLFYFRCPRLEGACTTSPCQHGGTCVDHWSWQQCHCKDGLTGRHCEKCMEGVLLSSSLMYTQLWFNQMPLRVSFQGRGIVNFVKIPSSILAS